MQEHAFIITSIKIIFSFMPCALIAVINFTTSLNLQLRSQFMKILVKLQANERISIEIAFFRNDIPQVEIFLMRLEIFSTTHA